MPGRWLVTADRHLTLQYLLASLAYTGMFMAVLLLVHDKPRLRTMTLVLVGSGVVQALLAIVLLSAGASYQFMWQDIHHGTQATGTFVNRNHLAGYMYLCLARASACCWARCKSPSSPPAACATSWCW